MNNIDLQMSQGRLNPDSFIYSPSHNSGDKEMELNAVKWPSKTSPISPEMPCDEMVSSRTAVNKKLEHLDNRG